MDRREAISRLLEAGFKPKGGKKHDQYEKDGVKIGVPRHAGDLTRTVVANIKKAIEAVSGK